MIYDTLYFITKFVFVKLLSILYFRYILPLYLNDIAIDFSNDDIIHNSSKYEFNQNFTNNLSSNLTNFIFDKINYNNSMIMQK